ncbi:MAG: Ig-like domain-containing protein, partial [Candidatus Jorgensenbacteria bacterium]
ITAPASGVTVAAAVSVSATSTDDTGVVGVQFKLDGNNLGVEDTSAPYEIAWDTTTASNGSHVITAVARDAAGNSATSTSISVTVENLTVAPNVYGDSFIAPWGNASYGGIFDIANMERAAGGIRAIKATANAWGTVRPQAYANPKDVSTYNALEFDVYNTVGTMNPLNVFIQAIPGGSGSTVSFVLPAAMKPKPVAGQWTHVSIPLSLFTNGGNAVNVPGTRVNYINLQNDGTPRTFYIDNMQFK